MAHLLTNEEADQWREQMEEAKTQVEKRALVRQIQQTYGNENGNMVLAQLRQTGEEETGNQQNTTGMLMESTTAKPEENLINSTISQQGKIQLAGLPIIPGEVDLLALNDELEAKADELASDVKDELIEFFEFAELAKEKDMLINKLYLLLPINKDNIAEAEKIVAEIEAIDSQSQVSAPHMTLKGVLKYMRENDQSPSEPRKGNQIDKQAARDTNRRIFENPFAKDDSLTEEELARQNRLGERINRLVE